MRPFAKLAFAALLLITALPCFAFESEDAVGKIAFGAPAFLAEGIKPAEKWQSPAVSKEFRFEAGGAAAVLVSTRIRAGLPADDRVLDRVEPGHRQMQERFGEEWVRTRRFREDTGDVVELAVFNNVYGEHFPYGLGPDRETPSVTAVGLSQMMVRNARLIEAAIQLPALPGESREALLGRAQALCTEWRASVQTTPPPPWAPDLPSPPDGYSWVQCPETRSAFLKPADWHFKKLLRDDTWGYFITKEDIDATGEFLTGLTVNVVTAVPSKAGVAPSVYAAGFVKTAAESVEVEQVPWQTRMGPFLGFGVRLRNRDEAKGDFITHHLAVANDVTGTLYILSFESPAESWPAAWSIAEPMLQKLYLDDGI